MDQDANTQPFTLIGRVDRSHGLHGEVKIIFEFDDPDILNTVSVVYLRNERGDYFPARISEIRTEEKGNVISFFVQFEHIADRTAAEGLKNSGVYLETDIAQRLIPEEEEATSLLHYDVYDTDGEHIGVVMDIMGNSMQTVLNISSNSGSLLIPYVDHFIVEENQEEESIICQNLEDLGGL
ncbi:MAG: 16S rRNA processing protein RimM [Balneola sp.]